ncbi:MAG: DciA family protein [Candidatus Omnitrophota bacterium]
MATHIKHLLWNFLKNKKGEDAYQQKIAAIVAETLSSGLQKYVRIKNVRQGVLVFHSDASSATYELMLKKQDVLRAVQSKFPEIKDLKVTIRK